nr:hypothetical protein [Collinsella urealyticum]
MRHNPSSAAGAPGALAHFVLDRNAFLFGNIVPDILVGYMVPGIEQPLPYVETHFAEHEPIPKPREDEFWDRYVVPLLTDDAFKQRREQARPDLIVSWLTIEAERKAVSLVHHPAYVSARTCDTELSPEADPIHEEALSQSVLDLVLGAWAHLVADKLWNTRVNEFLEAHGGRPSESFRIKKQADFDDFGRLHHLSALPIASPRLLQTAERFPQYMLERRYVIAAIGVAHEIVRANGGDWPRPQYRLLTADFFDEVFNEVIVVTEELFQARMRTYGHMDRVG